MTQQGINLVEDDINLFNLMISDWVNSPSVNETSGELVKLYNQFSADLKDKGIIENIKSAARGITAVNGCDTPPTQAPIAKLVHNEHILPQTKTAIKQTLEFMISNPDAPVLPYDLSLNDLDQAAFRMCDLYGKAYGAPAIESITMSESHYPEYTFEVNNKKYSYVFLYSYLHYAYCSRFIDFSKVENIVEVGPGAGRQVEVIKKFHPHINFYLVDLGPTLYICNQYLKAIFPDSIVPYTEMRKQKTISLSGTGKIAAISNADWEAIQPIGTTFSFNTGVFCLMNPATLNRYLGHIKTFSDAIYLMEPRTDLCKKIYKMEDACCFDDFEALLSKDYSLVDRSDAMRPLNYRKDFGGFEMTMWTRNKKIAFKNFTK